MILILGGTTEGRVAVRVADEAAAIYYYSTKGTLQSIECAHGIRLTGAMNAEEMECFCRDHAIKLLIDAAHPFAQVLHQTIEQVSKCLRIPVIHHEVDTDVRNGSPESVNISILFRSFGVTLERKGVPHQSIA